MTKNYHLQRKNSLQDDSIYLYLEPQDFYVQTFARARFQLTSIQKPHRLYEPFLSQPFCLNQAFPTYSN